MAEKRSRKEIYEERLEVYNRERHLIGKVVTTVGISTVHLLGKTEKGAPRPIGSGVLFRNGHKLFILTAAHVAEEFRDDRPAYINLPGLLLKISGQTHASVNRQPDHEFDTLDYAIVRIDGEVARDLGRFAITAADVFNPPSGLPLGAGLVLVGFPARNFNRKGPDHYYYPPTPLESRGVTEKTYRSLGLDIDDHLILQWYNTMFTNKGVVRSRSLAGMSGGGVWLVPDLMGKPFPPQAPWYKPKLIAIFTEHRKRRSVLVATKVRHHLNRMMAEYPDLPLQLRFRPVSDLLG